MVPYQPAKKLTPFPTFWEIIFLHLLAVAGLILFSVTWKLFILMMIMYLVEGIGITLAYHRCLTHRSFEFKHKWLERVFTTIGTMSLQRGPIWWSSLHRLHHRYSDTPRDPHSSRDGFWYSHILWFAYLDPRWKFGQKVDQFQKFAPDIAADPYYRWLDRFDVVPTFFLWAVLYGIGGWAWFFWGGPIATLLEFHWACCVNSVSHRFGYRSFALEDTSTNNWLVGIGALGEGWHNNHHAFPSSPKHGFFKWWEFDLTYLVILGLRKLKLIDNLRLPYPQQVEARSREGKINYPVESLS